MHQSVMSLFLVALSTTACAVALSPEDAADSRTWDELEMTTFDVEGLDTGASELGGITSVDGDSGACMGNAECDEDPGGSASTGSESSTSGGEETTSSETDADASDTFDAEGESSDQGEDDDTNSETDDDSCVQITCLADNVGQVASGVTIKTTHVRAFLVTALSDSLIASISMYTANEQALDLTVEIRGDRPIDGPGELMASAVFPVGVGADWYTAEFDVPVRVKAGQRIWIAWNSVQGMLAPYAETGPRLRTLAYNSSDGEWHDFTRAPLLRATCCANGGVLDRGPGLAVCRPGSAQGQARHSLIRVRAGTRSLTASTRVPPTNSDSICPNNRQEHF